MKNNLNDILFLMDEFTFSHNSELGEQDSEPAPSSGGGGGGGGGGGYPTVTKWETGLTRSVANTIDSKVTWKSLNKLLRGKANTLL